MKNRFSATLFTLILFCFLTCCSREAVLAPQERPTIAIECLLQDSEEQSLTLFYTKNASETEYQAITDAVVTLTDCTDGRVAQFSCTEERRWTLSFRTLPSHEYLLEVDVPGYNTLSATTMMPVGDRIQARHIKPYSDDRSEYYPDMYGTYYNGFPANTPVWAYGMNYNPQKREHEIVEEICTDFPGVDNFNVSGLVYSLPANPSFPIPLFQELLVEKSLHTKYLRMVLPPSYPTLHHFLLGGSFQGDYYFNETPTSEQGYICIIHASPEYDRYLKEAIIFQDKKSDLIDIYSRDNLYTNIVGSHG